MKSCCRTAAFYANVQSNESTIMKNTSDRSSIPVVILCGGMGTRLAEETGTKPKPLVEIGERPILWHIMKSYAHHGFKNFILCLGYKGHMIRDYFLNYEYWTRDFRMQLGKNGKVDFLSESDSTEDWNITFADTGLHTQTGSRVKKIEKYVKTDYFFLTYGDGVSDVNINQLLDYHMGHGKVGTVTGVTPPSRFGELTVSFEKGAAKLVNFKEKPDHRMSENGTTHFINGGYQVFSKDFFKYLSAGENCVLEREPFEGLTKDNQFMMYKHQGFWQCMDTTRDLSALRELWDSGKAPWRVS